MRERGRVLYVLSWPFLPGFLSGRGGAGACRYSATQRRESVRERELVQPVCLQSRSARPGRPRTGPAPGRRARLARPSGLLARAQREGCSLVALDLGVDTSTPSGEAMANVM